MQIITLERMQEAVRERVAAAPTGFVYPFARIAGNANAARCLYQVDGTASCLVGQALHQLGVPIAVLKEIDCGDSGIHQTRVLYLLKDAGFYLTRDAMGYASTAQLRQDRGSTWAMAEDAATADRPVFSEDTQMDHDEWYDDNPLPLESAGQPAVSQ